MLRAVPDRSLDEILSKVSRSFYLSLAILPRAMRSQLSAAYLVARAADTIADTRLVQAERRIELLDGMRQALGDPARIAGYVQRRRRQKLRAPDAGAPHDDKSEAERVLLTRLGDCLARLGDFEPADRDRARKVLGTLITGMERDLARFADGERLVALETLADLDEYTYMAAGCVGEYWTVMTAAHVPTVRRLARPDFVARGVRLGKALQLVNVIRDAAQDLAQGRCYVPRALLGAAWAAARGAARSAPAAARAAAARRAAPAWRSAHIDAAFPYVMAIPRWEPRLRLAALWPLWIGLGTLEKLAAVGRSARSGAAGQGQPRRRLSHPRRVVDGDRRRSRDRAAARAAAAARRVTRAALMALAAAALFGASAPVAKRLLAEVAPALLAALLYAGAGLMALPFAARAWKRREAPLRAADCRSSPASSASAAWRRRCSCSTACSARRRRRRRCCSTSRRCSPPRSR